MTACQQRYSRTCVEQVPTPAVSSSSQQHKREPVPGRFYKHTRYKNLINMKSSFVFVLGLASSAASFPWLREDFSDHAKRGLEVVKKDPELVSLLQSLYKDQLQERDDFFAFMSSYTEGDDDASYLPLEKRTTTSCLSHTLPDFLPSNITGLKKFPEAAYPYKDPTPSDQRGPCPGMNTLASTYDEGTGSTV